MLAGTLSRLWRWLKSDGPPPIAPAREWLPPAGIEGEAAWEGNPEALEALRTLRETRKHLFLTGSAGTGKSTLIQYWRRETRETVQVVAPTGIAALNVEGETIHRFFGFEIGLIKPDSMRKFSDRRRWEHLQTLIIDEVGMVRADLFDGMESFLRQNGPKPGAPWGGVRVVLVGDPLQLPPIVEKKLNEYFHRADNLGDGYPAPYFFNAHAWAGMQARVIGLRQIYRQEQHPGFARLLDRCRHGRPGKDDLEQLNRRMEATREGKKRIVLVGKNKAADERNAQVLATLPRPEREYKGVIEGDYGEEEKLPVPLRLRLRVGAWVMFVRNDPGRKWANGTAGIVDELGERVVMVRVFAPGKPVASYEVLPERWEHIDYVWDKEARRIEARKTGAAYTQLPLIHAWAVTIHRSQGKTLRRMELDPRDGTWAPGMTYTALSRLESLAGLTLTAGLVASDFKVSAAVENFLAKHGLWHETDQKRVEFATARKLT